MKIREVLITDCEAIMHLVKELAIYEKEPNAVIATIEHFRESGFGEKPVWKALVVEHENIIIGFALYYMRYSTWKGQRMYLEDFYVQEEKRGLGAGKLLFDELINICKQQNFSGLVWQVLDWNEPAINFYKKYDGVKFHNGWLNCSLEMQ
jgi:GNAT superfamily N-acetyltransferase